MVKALGPCAVMPEPDCVVVVELSAGKVEFPMAGWASGSLDQLPGPSVVAHGDFSNQRAVWPVLKQLANVGMGDVHHGGHDTT